MNLPLKSQDPSTKKKLDNQFPSVTLIVILDVFNWLAFIYLILRIGGE